MNRAAIGLGFAGAVCALAGIASDILELAWGMSLIGGLLGLLLGSVATLLGAGSRRRARRKEPPLRPPTNGLRIGAAALVLAFAALGYFLLQMLRLAVHMR